MPNPIKIALLATLLASVGCVHEKPEDCRSYVTLRVNVLDRGTGDDVTNMGRAGDVLLFMFDARGRFVDSLTVAASHVMTRMPVILEFGWSQPRPAYVAAWGNLSPDRVTTYTPLAMDALAMSLNELSNGYFSDAGELFFGATEMTYDTDKHYGAVGSGHIYVRDHCAPTHIIVTGLPAAAEAGDYYFEVESPFDGFDFGGHALAGRRTLCVEGKFDDSGRFVTQSPLQLIPAPDDATLTMDDCMVVSLYRRGTRAAADDTLIASTRGVQLLDPQPGHTTNIVITLGSNLSVTVIVTPMDEIWQNTIWQ